MGRRCGQHYALIYYWDGSSVQQVNSLHGASVADYAPSIASDNNIAWDEIVNGVANIHYWNGGVDSPLTADNVGHSNASISVNQSNSLDQIAWQNGDGTLSLATPQLRTALTGTISVGNGIGPVTLNGEMTGTIGMGIFLGTYRYTATSRGAGRPRTPASKP